MLIKGTGQLTKLLFRKDRVKIIVWLTILLAVSLAAAFAYPNVYKTEQDIMAFGLTVENPAMVAMIGPGYDLEDYSTATMFAHEMLLFTSIAVIVMNILFVGRATRADEEEGQLELVRSYPVGRLSYLSAAVIEALIVNLILAFVIAFGLFLSGLDGMDLESTMLYGSILGSIGFAFAGFTALFSQLAETSRGTNVFSFGFLLIAYFLRAIGDIESEVLSFLSPLGWIVRAYVFTENAWWPVFLSFITAILTIGLAYYLNSIRDMGTGFLPERKGRKRASGFLKTMFGFLLRQQRLNIFAWAFGIFLLSASFGSIMGELESYFADVDLIKAFLGEYPNESLTNQFLSLLIGIMALFSVIPAIMSVLKLKSEEFQNRTEFFYSRAVSRPFLFSHYFLFGLIVTVVVQMMIPLGLWSTGSVLKEMGVPFNDLMKASLAYIPALWIYVSLTAFIIGWFPKLSNVVWIYFGYSFIVLYLKELLKLPDWLVNISVVEHVPNFLTEDGNLLPLFLLMGIALLLYIIGIVGYKRRDIVG
ncbi:ABC transporter permease [Fervidibacillus halotolerans]|uniref:ABC transporter permease n=1 Tax=Fervidibacillus halotolerans TaxID=2980027 RepID=A0A9E8RZP1_9BACI|nr:ABC transporter permease [Fervidibacillus halotolerans]WAA13349.1 ABC transporter permease [Fervidibacillus halotolerans]